MQNLGLGGRAVRDLAEPWACDTKLALIVTFAPLTTFDAKTLPIVF